MTTSRLHAGLQIAALVAAAATFAVLALLAPGVLLLEPGTATAIFVGSVWTFPVIVALAAIVTALHVRRFGPAIRALELGEGDVPGVDAAFVRRLHALPLVWVLQLALQTIAVFALTILPEIRPSVVARETQISFVLLTATLVAAAGLPVYVAARALVRRTMEAVPFRVAEEAMRAGGIGDDDEATPNEPARARVVRFFRRLAQSRVQGRLANAVMLAVAIVAFGALLLVDAHVRAFETRHRRDDAYALARGVLEPEGASASAGRDAAIRAAEDLGYNVTIHPPEYGEYDFALPPTLGEGGVRSLRTKLEDVIAVVRFKPTSGGTSFEAYALAAAIAIAMAALVGRAFGRAVSHDLSGAAREVRLLGTADVLRGATRVAGPARFDEVAELGLGVEEVAERFREFAHGRERMIEARESAQRMRDLFLASMSHDLRSPLNGILGFVELLKKHELRPGQVESLTIVDRRGRELLELIENILDAAKIEAGRLELARDWIAPAEILASAVRRGRELALEKGDVEVRGELQHGLAPIWVDGPRITQAVINLVANAVKYCDRGVVRVRFSRASREGTHGLRIDVEDQGRGIPEKDLAQIFDAFRQPLRARRHGGLGLGLTMTRALVELHEGTIEVASSPEHGSVFTLFVPHLRPEGDVPESRPLWRMPTPVPGSRPPYEVVDDRQADHEDPTVQMPALEIPPESDDEGTPPPIDSARHAVDAPKEKAPRGDE